MAFLYMLIDLFVIFIIRPDTLYFICGVFLFLFLFLAQKQVEYQMSVRDCKL